MKKITLNKIVEFRYKSEKNQKGFLKNINKNSESSGGGNYWVRSLSAMSNAVKLNDHNPIKEKITEILKANVSGLPKRTKDMYDRNLKILYNYQSFDFSNWLPKKYEILSKTNTKTILEINTIPVQITPSQIFSFDIEDIKSIGAVWFVARLNGYRIEELGMFAEALFIYLTNNFGEKHQINPKYCIVIDVLEKQEVRYVDLINKKVSKILDSTLELIKKQF